MKVFLPMTTFHPQQRNKIMAKIITFHARRDKNDPHPTHTLAFAPQSDNVLLCTFSKPHPGLESYCKVTGNQIVEKRMNILLEEMDTDTTLALTTAAGVPKLTDAKRFAPACVRKTLKYYTNCARKYFKMTDTNPVVIVRGQRPDWENWMENGRTSRVPVKAATFSKYFEEL